MSASGCCVSLVWPNIKCLLWFCTFFFEWVLRAGTRPTCQETCKPSEEMRFFYNSSGRNVASVFRVRSKMQRDVTHDAGYRGKRQYTDPAYVIYNVNIQIVRLFDWVEFLYITGFSKMTFSLWKKSQCVVLEAMRCNNYLPVMIQSSEN